MLAIVGRMAPCKGRRNHPRWTMSLLARLWHVPVLQLDNFVLTFRTLNTHSLIQFTSFFLLQLVIRALRNLGSVVFSTWRACKFDLTRFTAYIGLDDRWIFCREYVGSKPQTVIRIVCQILDEVTVRSMIRIRVGVIQPKTIFRIPFLGQIHELLFISDVYQSDKIMDIQWNISTVSSLMKLNLRNQNYADISVMPASCKQVTHLLGINVVLQIF